MSPSSLLVFCAFFIFFKKREKALKKNVKFLKRAGFWLVSLDDWMLQSSQSPLKRAEVVVLNCCITVKRNVSICSSAMLREQFDSRPLTVYQPTNLLLLINFLFLAESSDPFAHKQQQPLIDCCHSVINHTVVRIRRAREKLFFFRLLFVWVGEQLCFFSNLLLVHSAAVDDSNNKRIQSRRDNTQDTNVRQTWPHDHLRQKLRLPRDRYFNHAQLAPAAAECLAFESLFPIEKCSLKKKLNSGGGGGGEMSSFSWDKKDTGVSHRGLLLYWSNDFDKVTMDDLPST